MSHDFRAYCSPGSEIKKYWSKKRALKCNNNALNLNLLIPSKDIFLGLRKTPQVSEWSKSLWYVPGLTCYICWYVRETLSLLTQGGTSKP